MTLLHTADLHSHLFPERIQVSEVDAARGLGLPGTVVQVGGAARVAAILESESLKSEWSAYFDAGDLFEGTPVFDLFGGAPELSVQLALAPDATALGNHDLGAGLDALRARTADAPPLLGGNLESDYPDLVVTDTVLEREGLRVAVIGLGRAPDHAPDIHQAADIVNASVARLRATADLVVVLSHLGRDGDLAIVPLTSGVDVILGGHTHDVLEPPEIVLDCGGSMAARQGCHPRDVLVVHSGAYGRFVGRLDIVISDVSADASPGSSGRRSQVTDARFRLVPVTADVPDRADVGALLAPYAAALKAAGFDEPIAEVPTAVEKYDASGGDSALGNFVTRALRTLGEGDLGVINSTALRADLPAGVLTRGELFNAMPFSDELVGRVMTGHEIALAFTEIARASCERDRETQVQLDGGKVVFGCSGGGAAQVSLAGAPLQGDQEYRVLTSDFLTGTGSWFAGPVALTLGRLRDAIEAYVRRGEPCPGSPLGLPCIDSRAGAAQDGRISWQQ